MELKHIMQQLKFQKRVWKMTGRTLPENRTKGKKMNNEEKMLRKLKIQQLNNRSFRKQQ